MCRAKINNIVVFFVVYFFINRIKSGNPGYFVAFNPTDNYVAANFSFVASLPDQLTVDMVSRLYNVTDVTKK